MKVLKNLVDDIGACMMFLRDMIRTGIRTPCTWEAVCVQIWKVTVQSLPTTMMAGFFVGAIMTVQFTMQIKAFGALGYLGGLATSATVREVGPLLIAFLLSGKVGAFTSAELGTMRVTEQIDAIRCLGANPLQEIILPRFLGIVISSFILLAAGLLMSIFGGLILGAFFAGINPEEYIRHIPTIVSKFSIYSGLFKCLVFAMILASVCTYKGYTATGGAKGVGRAVVSTAVMTMVGIVVSDWLTSLLSETTLVLFRGDLF
ncbi:MAG: ABC transporter permease [Bdellovibrionales bacterium]|nr:ABC transporter permease [Bdellovibrionales bacterium]